MRRSIRIVVDFRGGIGDAILLTPTFRAIKEDDPDSRLVVYYKTQNTKKVFEHNPRIDSLKRWTLLRQLIFYLAGALSTRAPRIQEPTYGPAFIVDSLHAATLLGQSLQTTIRNIEPEIFLTANDEFAAQEVLKDLRRPIVAMHTSGRLVNKSWPDDKWSELVGRNPDITFLQLGSQKDKRIAGAVFPKNVDLRFSFAVVKHADMFVGIDSAFAHAATALSTPAIVMFGASNAKVWGYSFNENVQKVWECSPCIHTLFRDSCPYGRPCMRSISVSEIEDLLRERLTNVRNRN